MLGVGVPEGVRPGGGGGGGDPGGPRGVKGALLAETCRARGTRGVQEVEESAWWRQTGVGLWGPGEGLTEGQARAGAIWRA